MKHYRVKTACATASKFRERHPKALCNLLVEKIENFLDAAFRPIFPKLVTYKLTSLIFQLCYPNRVSLAKYIKHYI